MNIALVNVSADDNRGATALTWAAIQCLLRAVPGASIGIVPIDRPRDPFAFRHTTRRYPDIRVFPVLFDRGDQSSIRLLANLTDRLWSIARLPWASEAGATLDYLRTCTLVAVVGGVKFETIGGSLRNDGSFLAQMLPLCAAQRLKVPTAILGAQFGPFNTRIAPFLFRRMAARCEVVFPRDRTSEVAFRACLPSSRVVAMPDSAFTLSWPGSGNDPLAARGLDSESATLALVASSALRASEAPAQHVEALALAAERLLADAIVSQVIVVVQVEADRAISRALARRLRLDDRCLIDADDDPQALSELYGACRLVISSRMHGCILAMIGGTPAVSLAPEVTFKERAVLDMLGLGSSWVPSASGAARIAEACAEFGRGIDRHRRGVAAAVAAAREQLDEMARQLSALVTPRP